MTIETFPYKEPVAYLNGECVPLDAGTPDLMWRTIIGRWNAIVGKGIYAKITPATTS